MNNWPENGIYNNAIHDPNPHTLDPSSIFNSNNVDINQLQNAQFQQQQRMNNGIARNTSPAFPNQSYQVNPVIPSKRARPSEDGISASPRQAPGTLNQSRSQTPQSMGYGGFQGGQHGAQPLQAQTPYQHLHQGGSANATPSPTMQNQQFRQPGPAQRVNTVSPSPFPQPQQNFGMSPQGDPNSRMGTPQNSGMGPMAGMNFMPGGQMPQGFNQNPGFPMGMSPAGMTAQGVQLPPNLAARQAEQQRRYQMQMLSQQHALAANQQRQQAAGMNPMHMAAAAQQMNPAMAAQAMRAQQGASMAQSSAKSHEHFVKQVATLMHQHGLPFNPNPVVANRPVNLMQLFGIVIKPGGIRIVTQAQQWPAVAQALGFPPAQFPMAGAELRQIYEQNLLKYEEVFQKNSAAKRRADMSRQAQIAGMQGQQGSPTKMMQPGGPEMSQQQYMQQLQQRMQQSSQLNAGHGTPVQNNAAFPQSNGWATPQSDSATHLPPNAVNQHRKSASRQLESSSPQVQPPGFPPESPAPPDKPHAGQAPPDHVAGEATANGIATKFEDKFEIGTHYNPKVRTIQDTHGGLYVHDADTIAKEIAMFKPNIPTFNEMGIIDMRCLSLSIQSGIHAEVRYALDHLARISSEAKQLHQVDLAKCEDMVDVLIDCAEEQVETLLSNAPEVSDIIDLTPYEDVIRNTKIEVHGLQDIPEFGSEEYELNRAADRLISITTILRNFSFFEPNLRPLTSSVVIKCLSNAIRALGTRNQFLRSHRNTQDFMKDVITFLSNVSHELEIPSREEAHVLLQFLLAFAPCPPPTTQPLHFVAFNPQIHRYLPCAVDSLAKLLARDEPNRHYYRHVFNADANSNPPYDLLTRAFALAISVIPDRAKGNIPTNIESRMSEARKPYLIQAMLAADILASLAPGPESGIARAWLEAEDGWAASLLRMACYLCQERPPPAQQPPVPPQQPQGRGAAATAAAAAAAALRRQEAANDVADQGWGLVTHRAFALLRRLGEKSRVEQASGSGGGVNGVTDGDNKEADGDEEGKEEAKWRGIKAGLVPKSSLVLGALMSSAIDAVALKQLCAFAGMEW
ncbi:hypothetical protein M501DRAFT_1004323 [Patellaria atrata CBS 101060]|uniref:ARID domain-containing protein n=1 Tax=Patellaria atrata CBS 101060 TaxID=1346257 RepID=A0A9P4VQP5_9PEZI|nr:hypothetical protein M501DRAFT_1004323 [Patellaria atrata CBS 101060]